jgi:chaperonin GroES
MSAVGGFKKLVPLLNRVLVKKVEPVTKSKSGIIMSTKGDQVNIGTIVATGQGNLSEEGKILPI